MGRALGFLSLLTVLAAGMWLYSRQAMSVTPAGTGNVRGVADTTGVENDLLAIANAERGQFALEGKYLALDELRSKGTMNLPSGRAGYSYSVEVGSQSFRAVASYSGAPGTAPATITIDQTMQLRTE